MPRDGLVQTPSCMIASCLSNGLNAELQLARSKTHEANGASQLTGDKGTKIGPRCKSLSLRIRGRPLCSKSTRVLPFAHERLDVSAQRIIDRETD